MPQDVYEQEVNNTYLALHISLAESFAYGAYEFLARGVPCLVSPTIARNFNLPLYNDIVIQNVDSVKEIADRIQYIVESDENYYRKLSDDLYLAMRELKGYNNASIVETFREQGIV
jgi:glycosyltransferase involved in cell wall biosynthesis